MSELMGARTGGGDDIACCIFKHANGVLGDSACIPAQAGVELRLSAAGLVAGEVHVNAEAVENIHDGLTSLRVERIDKTGNEKLDVGHVSILIQNPNPKSLVLFSIYEIPIQTSQPI